MLNVDLIVGFHGLLDSMLNLNGIFLVCNHCTEHQKLA
jgi:hypothetical protein